MAGFGGSVKLTGESEYRKALTQITQNLKTMSSALKSQTADFNANDKSVKQNAAQQKTLSDSIKTLQSELAKAKNSYAQYSVSLQAQQTRHNALNKEYKNAVSELDRIRKTSGETSSEYQKQAQVVDKLGQELAESTVEMNDTKSAMSSLKAQINNTTKDIDKASDELNNLGNEAEDSGEKAERSGNGGFTVLKGILANLGAQVITSCVNGLKQMGAALVNVGKQAIQSYAEFEQLQGGVESMFGGQEKGAEQINKVMELSRNAWESLTMSQNEYITAFNSTYPLMKNDIEDQNEAINATNRIMTLNSDLANTFGYSMEQASTAVNWALKGTYSYLDNLNIGIKGTKEGFLEAAQSVGYTVQSVDELTSSDILDVLEKCAARYGVLGKTAAEASGTIQGSTKMMKAAWQNLLTGMADDSADFGTLVDNLVNSVSAFGKQILPRVKQVIQGLGQLVSSLLQELVPELIREIPPLIQETLPVLVNAVQTSLQALLDVMPMVIDTISQLIPQIISTLLSMLPQLLDVGIKGILSLIQGITQALPDLIKMLPTIIKGICDTLLDNLGNIIDAGIELCLALLDGIIEALPDLIEYIPELIDKIINAIAENFPKLISSGVDLIIKLAEGLIKAIPSLLKAVPQIIQSLYTGIINLGSKLKESGQTLLNKMIEGIKSLFSTLGSTAAQIGSTIIDKIKNMPQQMLNWGKDMIQGLINGIKNMIGRVGDAVGAVANKIKSFLHFSRPDVGALRDYEEWMPDMIQGLSDSLAQASPELINQTKALASGISDAMQIEGSVTGTGSMAGTSYGNLISAFKEALSQMKIEMNDEEMGRFVDKTVAQAIYS